MGSPVTLVKRRPAETAMPVTVVIATLIARLAGFGNDDTTIFLFAIVLSFVPAAMTWTVELMRKRKEPSSQS